MDAVDPVSRSSITNSQRDAQALQQNQQQKKKEVAQPTEESKQAEATERSEEVKKQEGSGALSVQA